MTTLKALRESGEICGPARSGPAVTVTEGCPGRARSSAKRIVVVLAGALPVVLAWGVYRQVPLTYYFADDFVHFLDMQNLGFARFLIQIFGGHVYCVRNVLFYAAYQAFGFNPQPYYTLALLTHLLNVWLLFRVIRRLTNGDLALACLGATLWGTSPLAAGTIAWFSVYGHEMVATILLVVLDGVTATDPDTPPPRRRVAAWCLLMLAGMTCYGVGIGVAIAFPVVLVLFVPATLRDARLRLALAAFPLLVAGFYFGYQRVYPLLMPVPMAETILSTAALRAIGPIASMLGDLPRFGIASLLSDFGFAPERFPETRHFWLVAGYVLALVTGFIAGDWTTRRRLLGLVALCLAVYAIISSGRANYFDIAKMEPFAGARMTRYHYVALIPITLALCLALEPLARRARPAAPLLLAVWLGVMAGRYQHSTWQVEDRMDSRNWVAMATQKIEDAIDSQPAGSVVAIQNEYAPKTVLGPALGPTEFPGLAGLFVLLHPDNTVRGRKVHFVEHRRDVWLKSRDPRWNHRLADLLVNTDAVAQPQVLR